MTEQEVRDFLAQFDKAREDFDNWPKWMQEAAVARAAAFPRTPTRLDNSDLNALLAKAADAAAGVSAPDQQTNPRETP